ncbi:MAG: UDP-3-O-(3-hydroxymyristoyl)glucosamine N-acyltransferase [Pseudomonadales bacterium]|nr:UDP-3-O-(3-hydroxymyristoyl)glucosamine N-acyltransferase [Pseudomonadales bacterium]
MSVRVYTLKELAEHIDAKVVGDNEKKIYRLATLQDAAEGELSFLSNSKYLQFLESTTASAVIVDSVSAESCSVNALVVEDPYFAYAKISRLFDQGAARKIGVHRSAVISSDCNLGSNVSIAANVVIESGVNIGNDVSIGAGSYIGADCSIGDGTTLKANVSLYHAVTIGLRGIIHSGAVIGSDGFGFANHQGRWEKVHQLGGVTIGDDVDVGASTCIDRGAISDTIIGNGVKLDNQIQIAHNVVIGEHTAIAGNAGVAGSAEIGSYCTIGGASAIAGHIKIADHVHVSGMAMVTHSLNKPGVYSSGTGLTDNLTWRKNTARFKKLDEYTRRLFKLEKKFEQTFGEKNKD